MTREHFVDQLHDLDRQVLAMGSTISSTIDSCIRALEYLDAGLAQELIEADKEIDQERHDIEGQALLLIATQQPMAGDLRSIVAILTIISELERMGDYCQGIAKLTLRMAAEPVQAPMSDIRSMTTITRELLSQALEAYARRDLDLAGDVWVRDDQVDELYEQVFRKLLLDMVTEKTNVRQGTYILWVAHNLERMADRVANIAERVAFVVTGEVAVFRERLRAQTVP
jgi:phosphate transport system protein